MLDMNQLILILRFLPVICFIVLPLFVACFGRSSRTFDIFKPAKNVNLSGEDHEPDPAPIHFRPTTGSADSSAPNPWGD